MSACRNARPYCTVPVWTSTIGPTLVNVSPNPYKLDIEFDSVSHHRAVVAACPSRSRRQKQQAPRSAIATEKAERSIHARRRSLSMFRQTGGLGAKVLPVRRHLRLSLAHSWRLDVRVSMGHARFGCAVARAAIVRVVLLGRCVGGSRPRSGLLRLLGVGSTAGHQCRDGNEQRFHEGFTQNSIEHRRTINNLTWLCRCVRSPGKSNTESGKSAREEVQVRLLFNAPRLRRCLVPFVATWSFYMDQACTTQPGSDSNQNPDSPRIAG
jgi:hypothetical protein